MSFGSLSTWLEDGRSRRGSSMSSWVTSAAAVGELEGGSRIGARYRHTTPEMAARVIHALDRRLTLALQVAEAINPAERDRSGREF
jgi:hypothetical protein